MYCIWALCVVLRRDYHDYQNYCNYHYLRGVLYCMWRYIYVVLWRDYRDYQNYCNYHYLRGCIVLYMGAVRSVRFLCVRI